MRVEQPQGERGSLKWMQLAVAERWPELEAPILKKAASSSVTWLSPIKSDNYAEYRDRSFLNLLGLDYLAAPLSEFWPRRGPQWDALGIVDRNGVVLVEAKAHVPEFLSPGTSAKGQSRSIIEQRLTECAVDLGADPRSSWATTFYQLANRLAHLWFLRSHGVEAYLVLVGFLGDDDMDGPHSAEVWDAAYLIASYTLGLPTRHKLSRFIIHAHPRIPNG